MKHKGMSNARLPSGLSIRTPGNSHARLVAKRQTESLSNSATDSLSRDGAS